MHTCIVVPTRDRPAALRRCLAALAAQRGCELEVVVVDDGSRDRGAVEAAAGAAELTVRVIRTAGVGPAAARNLGWRAAGSELVLFTDDDCEPAADWARLLAAAAERSGIAAGHTVAAPQAGVWAAAAQLITERLQAESLDPGSGRLGFAPSCNLGARREALARLPFSEAFPAAAGEDRDFSARAQAAGLGPRYVPEALVVHRPALGAVAFVRQQYRYGRGGARFRAASPGRGLASPGFYARLVRAGFAAGPGAGLAICAAQAATAAGVAAERVARRR